jgi:DNA-binding winged helix-turn-helix (wHTH) protein/Flp pilus assembly protein TadD
MRYRFGEFQLDVEERQLIRNGQAVYLRPRSFAMLRYLVHRPRHLIEKRELLDALWPGTVVSESALTQSIKEVRQALADDAHQPRYLETVPRVGYRFRSRVEQLWAGDGQVTSVAAQEAYVKGRYFLEKRTADGFRHAKELIENAIDQAPDFAPAYVALADCLNLLCNYDLAPPSQLAPRAKTAAQQALRLDSRLAAAHASLGFTLMYYDWDWPRAQRSLQQAIELDRHGADAHHWLGLCLLMQGKFDEAIAQMQIARSLDPLSLIILTNIGWVNFFARQYHAATQAMREAIDMDSHFPPARIKLAWCLEQMEHNEEAVEQLTRARQAAPQDLAIAVQLAEAQALAGNHAAARKALANVSDEHDDRYLSPYWLATASLALGETEVALRWLDQARIEHSGWLALANIEPKLDPLRHEPAFQDLLDRIGPTSSAAG